jgi:signal peptidase I
VNQARPASEPSVAGTSAGRPSGLAFPGGSSVRRSLLELPVLAGLAVAIVVLVRIALVQAFYIPSGSMLPQLQLQDKVIVSRLAYRLHSPRRGDIVVFNAPPNNCREAAAPPGGSPLRRTLRSMGQWLGLTPRNDVFIKRVVGLPGDTVEGRDGHVFVDGRLLLEPYVPPGTEIAPFRPVHVPAGRLWVMGDNRNNSCDSRIFGAIRERSVLGRAFLRVWPLSHVAFL